MKICVGNLTISEADMGLRVLPKGAELAGRFLTWEA